MAFYPGAGVNPGVQATLAHPGLAHPALVQQVPSPVAAGQMYNPYMTAATLYGQ